LTPGAIEAEEDEVVFLKDTPQAAFTDDATKKVLILLPDRNPTKVVGREYLLADKSDLILDAAKQFQDTFRTLLPVIMATQPVLSKIAVDNVREDGHIAEGEITWQVEIATTNQPGMHATWQSVPTKRTRIEIPVSIKEGRLQPPHLFKLSGNRVYPLTVEGCQLALKWKEESVVKKMPPRVERSWQEERDYRAF